MSYALLIFAQRYRAHEMTTPDTLLRRQDVERRIGFSTSWLYAAMTAGTFPRPVHIGASVRWRSADVDAWIEQHSQRDAA